MEFAGFRVACARLAQERKKSGQDGIAVVEIKALHARGVLAMPIIPGEPMKVQ